MTPVRGESSQLVIVSGKEEGGSECWSGSGVLEGGSFLNYSILTLS